MRAQEQDAPQDIQQDMEHAVARISVIAGDVSVERGDSGERSAAVVNAPLVAGDVISTGPGSRAEIQLDHANVARLASDSEVRLSELTGSRYQLQVARGTVMFSVVRDSRTQAEISTPSVSVRPGQRGAYRISVSDDGHSEITARAGEAEVFGPRGAENLRVGNTMMVQGDPSDPEFQVVAAIQQDDFDRWNADRDQRLMRSTSYQHVSPDVYGAEDLDSAGRWVDVPEYGNVWSPSVGADWAPYRNGRWVWEDWYGWTWVSYDSWGWAPFHYGRWFWGAGYGWCWSPGAVYGRHYWSPALVSFFGVGGFNVGIGFGGAGFGWVPLAPFETGHRWWGRDFYGGYRNRNVLINNIHIANNVNIINNYRNARIGNGVTAVNANDFAHGRFTNRINLDQNQLRQASLVRGQVPIAPAVSSLRFSDRPVTAPSRTSALNNGRFFSRSQPSAVNRVPFAQQQQSLAQINRQGGAASENTGRGGALQGARAGTSNAMASPGGRPGAGPMNSGSVRPNTTQDSNGWRRFGGSTPLAAQSPGGRPAAGMTNSGNLPRADSGAPQNNGWRSAGPLNQSASRPNSTAPANSGGGWRRFGDSPNTSNSSQAMQPAYRPPSSNDSAGRGWQRFGAPTQPAPRNNIAPQSNTSGWRSPGDRPATAAPSTGGHYQSSPSDGWRRFQPSTQPAPRSSSPSYENPRSLQIAPPIVRERSTPSYTPRYSQPAAPSYSTPSYQPRYSQPAAPRYSSPSYQPRYSQPAPRYSSPSYQSPRGGSGGGGYSGGSRQSAPSRSSGSGGSHQSSGGGGGHSSSSSSHSSSSNSHHR